MNKCKSLTPKIRYIIVDKGTELPNSGVFNLKEEEGTYLCRQCGQALFRGNHKFISQCGWPSFDDEIPDRIKRRPDADGRRTEILCSNCDAHLGHVFIGEHHTEKNLRHCVNSLSIDFVKDNQVLNTEEAIVAGGCFWGIQHSMHKAPGVVFTEVGYSGGDSEYPTYEQVCKGITHHLEAVRVIFDTDKTNYENILRHFFDIHDATQANGQGPDIGEQYQSAIYYYDESQLKIAKKLISSLQEQKINIVTKLFLVTTFWPAEEYHQHYYEKNNILSACKK